MLGTIVNTAAILVGCIFGRFLHKGIRERYRLALYDALGVASLAIGLHAALPNFSKSAYPVLFIVSICLGTAVGTWLNIDRRFHLLVGRFSKKNSGDLASGLSTAILLYCIGPLSMLGPVMSALQGDHTLLYTNATLDFISSVIFSSTYGFGIALSAPVLFLWQALFYVVARLSSSAISDALMAELLIAGGMLIVASGFNLLRITKIKTLDMLPALLVPVLWFLLVSIFR